MPLFYKKSHRFALISAIYITVFSAMVLSLLLYIYADFSWLLFLLFETMVFLFSFFLLQIRVEHFIYQRLKKVYEDISFLDTKSFSKKRNTDLSEITSQMEQFATEKKLEIELLNDRETYRREFLGNVSHELKTPLFTVQGYIATLLDIRMKDKVLRKKYLERTEKGVERLIYIVEDLDTIAKLEISEKSIEMQPFDIVGLIQGVFDLLEMKANKKDIMLLFDEKQYHPIMAIGNFEKIQQVVTNLIVNSIKYGKIGGSTEVGIEGIANNKVLITVTDNGEGIEKHNIPRLFERFFRVDKSGARSEGGSGLGLAIVKHIVEAHNERIFVESTIGVGSEFSFTLQKTI